MENMDNTLEAIQSLPSEYRDRINKHCIPGDPDSLTKALDVALTCYQESFSNDNLNAKQKIVAKIIETIRRGLATELLRMEGFDLEAAKNRGKAASIQSAEEPKKTWGKAAVQATEGLI